MPKHEKYELECTLQCYMAGCTYVCTYIEITVLEAFIVCIIFSLSFICTYSMYICMYSVAVYMWMYLVHCPHTRSIPSCKIAAQ